MLPRFFPSRRTIVSVEKEPCAYEWPVTKVVVATRDESADIRTRLGRPDEFRAAIRLQLAVQHGDAVCLHHAAFGEQADPGCSRRVRPLAVQAEAGASASGIVQRGGGELPVVAPSALLRNTTWGPASTAGWVGHRTGRAVTVDRALGADVDEVSARKTQAEHRRDHDHDPSGALHAGPPAVHAIHGTQYHDGSRKTDRKCRSHNPEGRLAAGQLPEQAEDQ